MKTDIQTNKVEAVNDVNGNFSDTSHAKVYVKTWGCAHNSSDSEYMAGQLAAQGYSITNNKVQRWIRDCVIVSRNALRVLKPI